MNNNFWGQLKTTSSLLQTYRFPALWNWAKMQKTWGDSLRALFYGPSWIPGAPRLGREEDKVNVS